MPPRWPRKPDRRDPAYRKVGDRINFAVHVAFFAAVNSACWFFHTLDSANLPWIRAFTLAWLAGLIGHAVYIFVIADYSGPYIPDASHTAKGDS